MQDDKKRFVMILALVALFFIGIQLPTPDGLPYEGQKALVLMIVGVIAMSLNVLPLTIIGCLLVVLQPVIKIATLGDAVTRFAQPTLFFVAGGFISAVAFETTGLSRRTAYNLAKLSKGKPEKLLFFFMMGAALLSTIFADMVVVIMMMPIAVMLLHNSNCEAGKSNFGRALMIGIPIGALIGGMGTPAGAAPNAVAISLLKETAGIDISFVQWSVIAMPIVLILTPIAYKIVSLAYKSEISMLKGMEEVEEKLVELGPMQKQEKKFLITFAIIVLGWLTESIHGFGIPIIAVIGAALMFLPFNNVLTWEQAEKHVAWSTIFTIFSINSLGTTIWKTGGAEWISGILQSGLNGFSPVMVLVLVGLFTVFIHLLVPVNSALVSIIIPIVATLAVALNVNPAFLALPVAFLVSCSCLLPLDAVPLVGFWTGYYKMYEMFKPGIFVSFAWIAVVLAVMLTLGRMMGLV